MANNETNPIANPAANNWIERYLHQVGEHLPARQRADVTAELRTLLADAVEDRLETIPVPEDAALAVLAGFGPPDQVAARYAPEGAWLIGSHLLPTYFWLVKMLTAVLPVVAAVVFALSAGANPNPAIWASPRNIASVFANFAHWTLLNIGLLTVIFAAIHWVTQQRGAAAGSPAARFDPRKLPPLPESAAEAPVSTAAAVARIYGIVLLMLVLNVWPQWFGFFTFSADATGVRILPFPVSALGFDLPVAAMNVVWIAALLMNVFLLRDRRWTPATRWAQFAVGVAGAAILMWILSVSPRHVQTASPGMEPILRIIARIVEYVLAASAAWTAFESIRRLYRLLSAGPRRDLPVQPRLVL